MEFEVIISNGNNFTVWVSQQASTFVDKPMMYMARQSIRQGHVNSTLMCRYYGELVFSTVHPYLANT